MKKVSLAIDEHLASLPEDVQSDMRKLDEAITDIFSGNERVVWQGKFWGGTDQSIIGYGHWSYVRSDKEKVDFFMVGLAAQKNYISLYVNAVEDGQYVVKKYANKLGKVKTGASSISFKALAGVNWDELMRVIRIAKEQG